MGLYVLSVWVLNLGSGFLHYPGNGRQSRHFLADFCLYVPHHRGTVLKPSGAFAGNKIGPDTLCVPFNGYVVLSQRTGQLYGRFLLRLLRAYFQRTFLYYAGDYAGHWRLNAIVH